MLLVSVSMMMMLIALVISGWLAITQGSQQVSYERRALASSTGQYLDYVLQQNLECLDNIRFARGVDIEDSVLEPEKNALHSLYLDSIFNYGVFITNNTGTILATEPGVRGLTGADFSVYAPVSKALQEARPTISDVFALETNGQEVFLMVTPLRNLEGRIVGLVGGLIDPTHAALPEFK